MRPIRLALQAFGPFAANEVVNFRSALETGLFLQQQMDEYADEWESRLELNHQQRLFVMNI